MDQELEAAAAASAREAYSQGGHELYRIVLPLIDALTASGAGTAQVLHEMREAQREIREQQRTVTHRLEVLAVALLVLTTAFIVFWLDYHGMF